MPFPALQALVVPTPGLVVTKTARVKPGEYRLQNGTRPALVVRGDGITVDFTGSVLRGGEPTALPNARSGIGVRIEGRNVTIKGLRARGYKIGLFASAVKGLKLIDCDLSYNWRQRLLSTSERRTKPTG